MKKSRLLVLLTLLIMCLVVSQSVSFAESTKNDEIYYFNDLHKIDKDKGFSLDEEKKIKEKDVHYGWSLGSLYVSGYTQYTYDDKENPVFLKNAGDKVVLGFKLEQDIDKLNGDETLTIASDKKGYDDYFQIKKTDFKRGALIVRHTDYQNSKKKPQLYTNYLSAKTKVNANTVVEVNEEGDYEVALDYVVKSSPRKIFGKEIFPSTSDYTIKLFKFSVRNGNSMVFPLDAETGEELSNKSFTENGFRIDLTKSHYLKAFVSRDVSSGEGAEDTRENKPARDGAVYTDEGLYTITVKDSSTGQSTKKKIYVGTDDRYKAYVTTGLSLKEIDARIADGESIGEDGNFIAVSTNTTDKTANSSTEQEKSGLPALPIIVIVALILLVFIIIISRSRKKKKSAMDDMEDKNI